MGDPLERPITWSKGPDFEDMYIAEVDGARWSIRFGEFPVEPLYTLKIDGVEALTFDDWPAAWTRPRV